MFAHAIYTTKNRDSKTSPTEKVASLDGLYKVTIESQSTLGVFCSQGKATIATLPNNEYEIKAVLYPIDPPAYAIVNPYYIHAIAKKSIDQKTFICSGEVYVTKGIFYKNISSEGVEINFKEKINTEKNEYQFLISPLTLWGFSPGKITNTGTLNRTSKVIDEESAKELEYCDKLKIR
jgi:hypothetical protein